jgi:hypothetical protein
MPVAWPRCTSPMRDTVCMCIMCGTLVIASHITRLVGLMRQGHLCATCTTLIAPVTLSRSHMARCALIQCMHHPLESWKQALIHKARAASSLVHVQPVPHRASAQRTAHWKASPWTSACLYKPGIQLESMQRSVAPHVRLSHGTRKAAPRPFHGRERPLLVRTRAWNGLLQRLGLSEAPGARSGGSGVERTARTSVPVWEQATSASSGSSSGSGEEEGALRSRRPGQAGAKLAGRQGVTIDPNNPRYRAW